MWATAGCMAEFNCNGATEVYCESHKDPKVGALCKLGFPSVLIIIPVECPCPPPPSLSLSLSLTPHPIDFSRVHRLPPSPLLPRLLPGLLVFFLRVGFGYRFGQRNENQTKCALASILRPRDHRIPSRRGRR